LCRIPGVRRENYHWTGVTKKGVGEKGERDGAWVDGNDFPHKKYFIQSDTN